MAKEGCSAVSDFIDFLNASPTAFHTVEEAKKRLQSAGYEQVYERADWKLEAGKRYFFTRNYSTIVAFAIGKRYVVGNGFHRVGAHTNSPCLKLKPVFKGNPCVIFWFELVSACWNDNEVLWANGTGRLGS